VLREEGSLRSMYFQCPPFSSAGAQYGGSHKCPFGLSLIVDCARAPDRCAPDSTGCESLRRILLMAKWILSVKK
jgi:hypothetical protein